MPLLLYRYILSDLLRVGLLTTAVLVTVIAFGAAIKPLANESLLSAGQTVKYIALAIVPMLQFALPFAFAFAATVVFQRMTAENEILAASVNGLSYRKLLLPVLGLGLALTLAMGLLTQSLIPRFWALMQKTIRADITELFRAAIARGEPFKFGDVQVHADRLQVVAAPPDTGADQRFILSKVVVAEFDREHRIERDLTAETAVADIHHVGDRQLLKLVLAEAVGYDGVRGVIGSSRRAQPSRALEIPQVFQDDPVFMSRTELVRLQRNPDDFLDVRRAATQLAEALRQQQAWIQIDAALHAQRSFDLTDNLGRRFHILADRINNGTLTRTDGRPVEVSRYDGDQLVQRMEVAELPIRMRTLITEPGLLELELRSYRIRDENGLEQTLPLLELKDLEFSGLNETAWTSLTSAQLLDLAHAGAPHGRETAQQARRLNRTLANLQHDIVSHLHRRYALCVMAPLLLLLGSVLAMWLRDRLPLTIFLCVFIPAILSIMLLAGGGQMVKDGQVVAGLSVLWSGSGLLTILLSVVMVRLMRN